MHLVGYTKVVYYYELLKQNQIITAERYQQQLIDQKHPIIAQRKHKVILLHNNP